MAKRHLTPEQTEKRDARRAKFSELVKRIGAMTEAERTHLAECMPCVVTVEGRTLSGGNLMLVSLQRPSVTVVGGFNQWKAQGRSVRKGESGMMIWAPAGRKTQESPAAASEPTALESSESPNFIMVTVFDISQTDAIVVEGQAA